MVVIALWAWLAVVVGASLATCKSASCWSTF